MEIKKGGNANEAKRFNPETHRRPLGSSINISTMAWDESHASNPLLADFVLVGRKLEQLDFILLCKYEGHVIRMINL
jgi:hypothetical protein